MQHISIDGYLIMDQSLEYTALLQALAAASSIAKKYFRQSFDINIKADSSPVTIADHQAERAMRDIIASHFPKDTIFGEEEGGSKVGSRLWVIDPIDGTKSFITGNPLFGCMVGFIENDIPKIGGVAMPALDELWVGMRGKNSVCNDKICHIRDCRKLEDAIMLSTSSDMFNPQESALIEKLTRKTRFYRLGGDCYIYAMVSAGWADLVVESDLKPYDFFPLIPIVQAAGGIITDWQGQKLTMESRQVIAAATPELHNAALEILNSPA